VICMGCVGVSKFNENGGVNERVQELLIIQLCTRMSRVCHADMHSVIMHWSSAGEREATS